jgi:hypothetical protein
MGTRRTLLVRDEKESRFDDKCDDIASLLNEEFIKVCRMDLARSGVSCTRMYPLNRNIFKDVNFLPSQVMEIPCHTDVETARFEDGATDIRFPSTRSRQHPAETLRRI